MRVKNMLKKPFMIPALQDCNILYPFDEEAILIESIVKGDLIKAMENGEAFINKLTNSKSGDLVFVKSCVLHLTVVLVRYCFQIGLSVNKIINANLEYISLLLNSNSALEIQKLLINFIQQLIIINVYVHKNGRNEKIELVKKAKTYINCNYMRDISLKEVADNLHLSPCYFSRLFSELSDCTFQEYLIKARIGAAQKLLREEKLGLKEIAYEVGYKDVSYFIRVFKKVMGITPRQYSKKIAPRQQWPFPGKGGTKWLQCLEN